jgi:hypothetical protein
MNETGKVCDICHRSVVCWPGVFTVLGPRDLCGGCYWRYRQLMDEIAAFWNRGHYDDPWQS